MKAILKLFIIMIIFLVCLWWALFHRSELRWDWTTINVAKISFDKKFIFGVAGAAYQYLGSENSPNSNWTDFRILDKASQEFGSKAGVSADFWNHLDDDIALMKEMKIKAFRFSFEWGDIEPEQGNYDHQAIAKYHDLFGKLREHGIEPFMTLHHFTHPKWFEAMGGFEHEKNIEYFVNFCSFMVQEFGDDVRMWATFNEPTLYATQGYIWSVWPPHQMNIASAGIVLKHILQAHVAAYHSMKKKKPDVRIGFVHSVMQFDPYHAWNPLERIACYYLNRIYHDVVVNFFSNGTYAFNIPFYVNITAENADAPHTIDFFGINYYSHVLLKTDLFGEDILKIAYRPEEIKTDTDLVIYPEGLYRAIQDVSDRLTSKLHIPIYITENGIADVRDDRRALFIERYLYALHKAIEDGYDVRGYFYWSLLDNFEWHLGYSMKFGLYHIDFQTQKRSLRCGANVFLDVIKKTYGG